MSEDVLNELTGLAYKMEEIVSEIQSWNARKHMAVEGIMKITPQETRNLMAAWTLISQPKVPQLFEYGDFASALGVTEASFNDIILSLESKVEELGTSGVMSIIEESREREKRLLKSMPYKEYLQTDHWKHTRKSALKRAEYRCQLCNGDAMLQVHHRTYERRGHERASDLIVLCRQCHKDFHRIEDDE